MDLTLLSTRTCLLLEKPLTHLNTQVKACTCSHTFTQRIEKWSQRGSNPQRGRGQNDSLSSLTLINTSLEIQQSHPMSHSSSNEVCACFFIVCCAGASHSIPPWLYELPRAHVKRSRFKCLSHSNFILYCQCFKTRVRSEHTPWRHKFLTLWIKLFTV